MSSSGNFYEQNSTDSYTTLEKVELAEDVNFTTLTNVVGKFYYKAMTVDTLTNAPSDNAKKGNITTSNYVELVIPVQLLLAFVEPSFKKVKINGVWYSMLVADSTSFVIPKGTIFLAELIGGRLELEKLAIVGLYISQEGQ